VLNREEAAETNISAAAIAKKDAQIAKDSEKKKKKEIAKKKK